MSLKSTNLRHQSVKYLGFCPKIRLHYTKRGRRNVVYRIPERLVEASSITRSERDYNDIFLETKNPSLLGNSIRRPINEVFQPASSTADV